MCQTFRAPLVLILFLVMIEAINGYKEFEITRSEISQIIDPKALGLCTTQSKNIKNKYYEICFEKDIAYTIDLYLNDKIYYVAMDFTIPISWLKSEKCRPETNGQTCSMVKSERKDNIIKRYRGIQTKTKVFDENLIENQAQITDTEMVGSTDSLQGIIENIKDVEAWVRDSWKATQVGQLLLMAAYYSEEKDKFVFKNTNFIKATKISSYLNEISDGGISLRFDQTSEKSFLSEMVQSVDSKQKVITTFIDLRDQQHSIAIGQVSLKYSKTGLKGINWISLQETEGKYGQVSNSLSVDLSFGKNLNPIQLFNSKSSVFFTLSSSFITFPLQMISELIQKLKSKHVANCQIEERDFLTCQVAKQVQMNRISINIQFTPKISMPIYLVKLVRSAQEPMATFNIKASLSEGTIILGEPVFDSYLMIFDYDENRIGFADKFSNKADSFFSLLISFLRFFFVICLIIIFFYICYRPLVKIGRALRRYPLAPSKKIINKIKNANYQQIQAKDEFEVQSYFTGNDQIF